MKLAIKGHPTRGKEVIQLLEMLGGKNIYPLLKGDALHQFYHIREDNNEIICFTYLTYKDGYKVFTLEEFEKLYPYKVGDKVKHEHFGSATIIGMGYSDNIVRYEVLFNEIKLWLEAKAIQPYKEENMSISEIREAITDCAEETIKLDIPKGYEFAGVDDDNQQVVFEKICSQYPKTYKECCKVLNYDREDYTINLHTCQNDTLFESCYELYICRNAYWKIAGKEMGLGKQWKPNWEDEREYYYTIFYNGVKIEQYNCTDEYSPLAFPNSEMRDAFYDNFKDLLKQCKELL